MKKATQVIYGLNGSGFLLAGLALLFGSRAWLTETLHLQEGSADIPAVLFHLFREAGALLLFASVLCFWYIRLYESRRAFHWAMTFFWLLMAVLHYLETFRTGSPAIYAGVNSIPAIAYLAVGPWRQS